MNLYIDIETIPTQRQDFQDEIRAKITAPGQYKKPESIAKWMQEFGEAAFDDAWRKTSFDGTIGEIICIGFALGDGEAQEVHRTTRTEAVMLANFNLTMSELLKDSYGNVIHPTWVGHNICDFDARFIWQRMVLNNVKPAFNIPYNEKPWSNKVFDTLYQWKGNNKSGGSLDRICKAMNLKGKGDIDGSKVWDYVKAGKVAEVAEYCKDDVNKTRQLYKRMMFEG